MSEQWETQLSRLKIMAADNGVLSEKDREAIREALRRLAPHTVEKPERE